MNEDQVKGVGEKGDAQQIAGEARKQVGNAEEDAKDATDEAVDRDRASGSVAP
ncbi:hypothetical protein [Caballeronia cordobensis]|uniref:hypothetical protein n=1 Tax=Caballeronia cordobensis TaxID=1353886 RepID=UPI000ACD1141|nr:hypothetical protein [Caballeronia cordobensis]